MVDNNEIDRAKQLFELTIKDPRGALLPLTKALSDTSKLMRLIASVQMSNLAPSSMARQNIRELGDILSESYNDALVEQFTKLQADFLEATDGNMDAQQEVVNAIATLNVGQAEFLVKDLIAYFYDDVQFYELGHTVLAIMFPTSHQMVRRDSINEQQLAVLSCLIKNDPIWRNDLDIEDDLKSRGLPTTRAEMLTFIGT
jgi:hypothetical protein